MTEKSDSESENYETIFDIPMLDIILKAGRVCDRFLKAKEDKQPADVIDFHYYVLKGFLKIIELRPDEFVDVAKNIIQNQNRDFYIKNAPGVCHTFFIMLEANIELKAKKQLEDSLNN